MTSQLVISLDFEMMWGVRDKRTIASYGDAVLGGRAAIPEILRLFRQYNIRATWATVGLLFARNRDEMLDYAPALKPSYQRAELSPYDAIRNTIGQNESDDPWHYGRSLVEAIRDSDGQELATHTYSHYYCLESGQTAAEFNADIQAAVQIAADAGVTIKSMVFPRNQILPDYLDICLSKGIKVFRGNPQTFFYRSRNNDQQTLFVRAGRLLDSVLPLDGSHGYVMGHTDNAALDIPASRMLRTTGQGLPEWFIRLQLLRVKSEMKHAAQRGQMYHLWWHPHNFGRNTEKNLAYLEDLLRFYAMLHGEYGMKSLAMGDFSGQALSRQK